jgi:hypothetical protein
MRHRVPFYARTRPLDPFMNAAVLSREPLILREGEEIRLRYRVLLHEGRLPAERIDREWRNDSVSRRKCTQLNRTFDQTSGSERWPI